MELQTLLDQYEKLIRSATSIAKGSTREVREKRAWTVYKFLKDCGVNLQLLEQIEAKYNY